MMVDSVRHLVKIFSQAKSEYLHLIQILNKHITEIILSANCFNQSAIHIKGWERTNVNFINMGEAWNQMPRYRDKHVFYVIL